MTQKTPTTDSTSINRVLRSDNPIKDQKMVSDDHDKKEEDTDSIEDEDNEDKDKDVKNKNTSDNKIAKEINDEEDEDRSNNEVDNEIEDKENKIENENNGNDAGLFLFSIFFSIYHFLTSMSLFFKISAISDTVIGSKQTGESNFY